MSSTTTVPDTAPRDVWLTVALAVAQGKIAHPDDFEVRPDIRCVDLTYNARTGNPLALEQAAQAAAWLNLATPSRADTRAVWWEIRDGWTWNVRAYWEAAEPSALAGEVVAAITGSGS